MRHRPAESRPGPEAMHAVSEISLPLLVSYKVRPHPVPKKERREQKRKKWVGGWQGKAVNTILTERDRVCMCVCVCVCERERERESV